MVACLTDINEDFQLLLKASEDDDKKDDDKDGIPDVDQMARARPISSPPIASSSRSGSFIYYMKWEYVHVM